MPILHSVDEIEQQIGNILEAIPDEVARLGIQRDAEWTSLIKRRITELGERWRYDVCATGFGRWRKEWIRYDLMWIQMMNEDRDLERVALVLESEWRKDPEQDIEPDFQKLIVARADLRAMVFQQRTAEQVTQVFSTLERQARSFEQRQAGDRYLLAGFSDIGRFQFHSFRV